MGTDTMYEYTREWTRSFGDLEASGHQHISLTGLLAVHTLLKLIRGAPGIAEATHWLCQCRRGQMTAETLVYYQ